MNQNDMEYLKDMMQQGKMTAAEANIQMILMARVRIVRGKMPAEIRKTLNAAVKNGILGHLKKSELKPECYYNPMFLYLAHEARYKIEREKAERLKKVFC